MSNDTPQHEAYEEMKDTPWITQARQIADIGGQGVLNNYKNVDVFDDATKASLEQRNREIYDRAFKNMEREYTNTMNKYAAKNYNQFGTLNATAPSFVTDQYRIDAQRQMDDLAYNQAVNYDDLMDRELARRYNTLNMYGNLYGYGNTPYQQDLANWNTRNTNKDISYQNQVAQSQSGTGWGNIVGGVAGTTLGALTGNPYIAIAGGQLGSNIGGYI